MSRIYGRMRGGASFRASHAQRDADFLGYSVKYENRARKRATPSLSLTCPRFRLTRKIEATRVARRGPYELY